MILTQHFDYFRGLCTIHPRLGIDVFYIYDIEELMYNKYRSDITKKQFAFNLILPQIRTAGHADNMVNLELGFEVLKHHSTKAADKAAHLAAYDDALKVALEIMAKIRADSQAGAAPLYYSVSTLDDMNMVLTPRQAGDTSYYGWLVTFELSVHINTCINDGDDFPNLINNYSMLLSVTQSERDAIAEPTTGQIVYNLDTSQHEYYNGTEWTVLVATGGGGGTGDYYTVDPNIILGETNGNIATFTGNVDISGLMQAASAQIDGTATSGADLATLIAAPTNTLTTKEYVADTTLQSYSAQFVIEGAPLVSIQHWGTFEQRSLNLLDLMSMANKTLANDTYNGAELWQITTNVNGNFFTFPNLAHKRLNIDVKLSIVCQNPPFDKGAVVHLKRGQNGTIVDDRSKSTIFQNFSTINPGQISFDIYTLAQGATDPYYLSPGGFGLQVENVTSTNAYEIIKIKMDCIATIQQL